MLLARHEHNMTEMERNRIKFYKQFKRIREQEKRKRTCRLIGELTIKHERKTK